MISPQDLVFETLRDAAIVKILAAFPFLNIPIIKQVFTFFARKILDKFYKEVKLQSKFLIIEFRVDRDLASYKDAEKQLKDAIDTNDEGKINEAKEEFKRRLAELIRFNIN